MELDADGKIIPVTVTKTNTMFFSAREVMERIPNLYERISYEQLLKMQKDIQTAQWEHTVEGEQKKEQTESQGRVSKEEKPDLSRAEQILQDRKKNGVAREIPEQKGTLELLGYQVDQGVLVARIQYKGEETLEGIWKNGEELYILTGMEVNHSLEKYSFRQEEKRGVTDIFKRKSDRSGRKISDAFCERTKRNTKKCRADVRENNAVFAKCWEKRNGKESENPACQ